ncbi:hypothetical protein WMF31_05400 [Sorangium sp. So ce1036]|uniref:hypothetical protein n=1 Tax=Sorangium sp. So ce1036 TaxID=3133328 RepID=UPI003F0E9399
MRSHRLSALLRAGHVLALGALLSTASCAQVLGLDEFEDCDEDSCSGVVWAKGFGNVDFVYPESAGVDSRGNVIVSGTFRDTVDFGGSPLISSYMAFFLAKLRPDGSHAFSRKILVDDEDGALSPRLTVLPDDSVVLTGFYEQSVDLGDGDLVKTPTPGGDGCFVARFSPDGELLWKRNLFTGTAHAFVLDLTSTPDGDVVLVGSFEREMNLGTSTLTTASTDAFITRLNGETGAERWSLQLGDAKDTTATTTIEATAVAADPDGNIIVGGRFTGFSQSGFEEGYIPSPSGAGAFVLKLVPTGVRQWTSVLQGEGEAWVSDIDVDARGHVLAGGALTGTIGITTDGVSGVQQTSGAADSDILLVKLSSAGSHVWSLKFGDESPQFDVDVDLSSRSPLGVHVAVDSAGDIALGAGVAGAVDFGGGLLDGRGDRDWTVAKISAGGEHLWSRRFGDPAALQGVIGIGADPRTDALMLAGINDGVLDFGDGMKVGDGGKISAAVAKIDLARVGR